MSFYDNQNTDQWGSAFGSNAPAYSSQPNYQSPASPAFQGDVPVIDPATVNQGESSGKTTLLRLF